VQRIDNEWVSAILGGTGGIANELCKIDVLDDVNGNNGYAFSSSVSGPSAHIEGEKINLINYSDPSNPKSTPLYKITFQVNPGNAAAGCKLSFAAYFGRTTPLLVGNSSNSVYQWSLEPGDSAISYAGSNMIVKISPNIYDEVCLKFTKISSKTEGSSSCLYGISEGDYLCNTIKEGTEQTYTDKDFESKNAWWNG
jgi:hypothetical protein